MFSILIAAVVFALVITAFAVVAGTISYLRDPQAMIRREQHRNRLALIDSI